jgi:hypothetical protein
MRLGGKDCAQDRGDPLRFLVNLLATQSLHIETERAQLEISSPVVLERLPAAVEFVAIGFDTSDVGKRYRRQIHRKSRPPARATAIHLPC